ncbi:GNAT family N-acetyltransferase [Amycolatopsis regifaucium]|uniref:GCN5 family acetyltransferase n=1 Tax=Amycolatopsis regifaucium TaxID=546365 RepID=A0A154MDF3_9PSEU|nr:GNAT family N-acetyltransferase [Amycolatopsis regifaucium]KZB82614.1 GCN5 family acetyltransferase [Amycolatopsis regifaucium]OKA10273.1 GNAT family N-acetyltransferase [Amycolatopsis regifaucium]SFG89971.1 Acetyltransferase (GNAT) family protein [Amycolatopsis regifaucium]
MLELTCSQAWPPLLERRIGDWRLRWADGFTARANSALAIGDPGKPLPEALRAVCDFAHDQAIPPVVQVIQNTSTEEAIAAQGWVHHVEHRPAHEVRVMTGPLPRGTSAGAAVLDEPTSGWWELTTGGTEPADAPRHVLGTGKVGFGVVELDGVTAGAVRGGIVAEWLHIARLEVRPEFRRRGLAGGLMNAIGAWGAAHGATGIVLQVAMGNSGALKLYESLGCTEHHRYRYWAPGPGACEDRLS